MQLLLILVALILVVSIGLNVWQAFRYHEPSRYRQEKAKRKWQERQDRMCRIDNHTFGPTWEKLGDVCLVFPHGAREGARPIRRDQTYVTTCKHCGLPKTKQVSV